VYAPTLSRRFDFQGFCDSHTHTHNEAITLAAADKLPRLLAVVIQSVQKICEKSVRKRGVWLRFCSEGLPTGFCKSASCTRGSLVAGARQSEGNSARYQGSWCGLAMKFLYNHEQDADGLRCTGRVLISYLSESSVALFVPRRAYHVFHRFCFHRLHYAICMPSICCALVRYYSVDMCRGLSSLHLRAANTRSSSGS
jgi:hypothetical protein